MSGIDKLACLALWILYGFLLLRGFDEKWVVLWMTTFGMLFFIVEAAVSAIKSKQ